jgi:hypothetical protein
LYCCELDFLNRALVLSYRFPDTGTRVAWQEALSNTILHHKHSAGALAGTRRAWVAKAVEGDSGLKGRGVLASAVSDEPSGDDSVKPGTPVAKALGSFSEGAGASHLHRLLRLRTERAMAPITGGITGGAGAGGAKNNALARSATAPAAPQRPPEVKVIINNQRGSPVVPAGRKQNQCK